MIMPDTSFLQIAQAQRPDARAIAFIHAESWRVNYRGAMTDSFLDGGVVRDRMDLWQDRLSAPGPNQLILVARRNVGPERAEGGLADIIGFACAYFGDDQRWGTLLDNLHVVPGAQGQGIGAALLSGVARWSHSRDPQVGLYLWVLDQNQKARRFYGRLHALDVGGDIWASPGGGGIPRRRYAWPDLEGLSVATPGDGVPARSP